VPNVLKSPVAQLKRLGQWLPLSEKQWLHLDLLKTLVQRDLQARYQGSILGNFWTVANQLLQLLIFTYVFSVVLQVKLSLKGLPANDLTYGLWLFAGLIPWNAFSAGLSQATTSVINQPNLVKKVVFPLGVLPLVPIFATFVESSVGLMILMVALVVTTQTLHATLLLLPIVWIPQLLLTIGLGYLVAGLTVFLRDIAQTVGVILSLWFYATPVIYPAGVIPENLQVWVFRLNPLTAIIESYRDLLLVGTFAHRQDLLLSYVIAVVVFILGWRIYRRLRPAFADVL
jgi:lipopolysaccharide transport system permease protein